MSPLPSLLLLLCQLASLFIWWGLTHKKPDSLLMQRRRSHQECHSLPHLGCLVFDTPQCKHLPLLSRLRRRFPFLSPVIQSYYQFTRAIEFWISLSRQGHIDYRSWQIWSLSLGMMILVGIAVEACVFLYQR